MSTRIYNTLRFPHGDLAAACRAVIALRPVIRQRLASHADSIYAKHARTHLINMYRFRHKTNKNPLGYVYNLQREQKKEVGYQNSEWDYSTQVILFDSPDSILGMIFAPYNGTIEDEIISLLGVESFDYWDHTDRPDEVSEGDWDERRRIWDVALPDGVPKNNGLVINLHTHYMGPPKAECVLEHLGDRGHFINDEARKIIKNDYEAALEAARPEPRTFSIARLMLNREKSEQYLVGDDGKAQLAEEIARLDEMLPNPFTVEMLLTIPEQCRE